MRKNKFGPLIIIIVALLALTFSSCKKEDKQDALKDETKIQILLNNGEYEKALVLIDSMLQANPDNKQIVYLQACAYAMKGGINIYSLYPILDTALFRKPSIEWNHMSDDQNPYVKLIDQYSNPETQPTQNNQAETQPEPNTTNPDSETPMISKEIKKEIMNSLWNTYQIIPYLDFIPYLTLENRVYIDRALEILYGNEFPGDYARQANLYLSLLSAIQFFNVVKSSLPKDAIIKSPIQFMCLLDADYFFDHSMKIRTYVITFATGAARSGLADRYIHKYMDQYNKNIDKLAEISEDSDYILKGKYGLKEMQKTYCQFWIF